MKELASEMASMKETNAVKVDGLTSQLHEAKKRMKSLAEQLTELERSNSRQDVDLRTTQRHLDAANDDNMRLKEEVGCFYGLFLD